MISASLFFASLRPSHFCSRSPLLVSSVVSHAMEPRADLRLPAFTASMDHGILPRRKPRRSAFRHTAIRTLKSCDLLGCESKSVQKRPATGSRRAERPDLFSTHLIEGRLSRRKTEFRSDGTCMPSSGDALHLAQDTIRTRPGRPQGLDPFLSISPYSGRGTAETSALALTATFSSFVQVSTGPRMHPHRCVRWCDRLFNFDGIRDI